ncbi:SDR family oxidoreductase [Methylobacterium radiodurans]|uniref:Uncharacterized protein n=1 Tax=Methylobacterium radiodurans TaxID=2202828 RepID=A0A2U8VQI4_9HYPH|nr:hypothetical protein DK427_09950 [Methylobacterium radiodurans]
MRRVLIYGGTGGIEHATAQALRGRGYAPHLAARNAGPLDAAAAEPGETTVSAEDVTDPDFFARATRWRTSLTRTPLAAGITDNASLAQGSAGTHALQRLGEPTDVGRLAAPRISDEAAWITGQNIGADGCHSTLRTEGWGRPPADPARDVPDGAYLRYSGLQAASVR